MAEVKATVFWDAQAHKVTRVQPDPAKLKRVTKDSLRWGLNDGGDPSAKLSAIVFATGGPKGPFNDLAATPTGTAWVGSNLKPENGKFKYAVTVTSDGGENTLDPDVDVETGP